MRAAKVGVYAVDVIGIQPEVGVQRTIPMRAGDFLAVWPADAVIDASGGFPYVNHLPFKHAGITAIIPGLPPECLSHGQTEFQVQGLKDGYITHILNLSMGMGLHRYPAGGRSNVP